MAGEISNVDFENYARLLRTYEAVDPDELREEFEDQPLTVARLATDWRLGTGAPVGSAGIRREDHRSIGRAGPLLA
jgi:hypothetical protein